MAGAPTKLTPELIGKAGAYLETCFDRFGKEKNEVNLPSIVGLALFLNVGKSTIFDWLENKDDVYDKELVSQFSDIVSKVESEQEKRLMNNGISGNYEHHIAALILGKHGYHHKTDQDIRVKELPTPILGGSTQKEDKKE